MDNESGQEAPQRRLGPAPQPSAESAAPGPCPDRVPWLIALALFVAYSALPVSYYLQRHLGSDDLATLTEYVKPYAQQRAPVADVRRSPCRCSPSPYWRCCAARPGGDAQIPVSEISCRRELRTTTEKRGTPVAIFCEVPQVPAADRNSTRSGKYVNSEPEPA